jgi:hypothetical protein
MPVECPDGAAESIGRTAECGTGGAGMEVRGIMNKADQKE